MPSNFLSFLTQSRVSYFNLYESQLRPKKITNILGEIAINIDVKPEKVD